MNKTIPIFLIGLVVGGGLYYVFQGEIGGGLTPQEAGDKAISYINDYALEEGLTASLLDVSEANGVYKIHLEIEESASGVRNEYDSYVSKDGELLFSSAFYIEEIVEEIEAETPEEEAGEEVSSGQLEALAKCLTEKGVKFYGYESCGYCKKQKELFGDALQYVTYIDCIDPQTNQWSEVCREAGIEGVPAWDFGEGINTGLKTFEQLSELSGCEL